MLGMEPYARTARNSDGHCRHRLSRIPSAFHSRPASTEIYALSLHDALPIWQTDPGLIAQQDPGRPALQGISGLDRKSTRLNSSHANISYAVFCLKKKNKQPDVRRAHLLFHNQLVATTKVFEVCLQLVASLAT